jgi:hypothetical protein
LPILLVAAGSTLGQAGSGFTAGGSNLAFSETLASMANNPANSGQFKKELQLWSLNKFTQTQLMLGGVSAQMKWGHSTFGINASYSGTEYFNRSKIEMGLAQEFSPDIAIGIALGWNKLFQALSYSPAQFISAKIGFKVKILPKVHLYGVISDPWTQNKILYKQFPRIDISFSYPINKSLIIHPQFKVTSNTKSSVGLAFSQIIENKLKLIACLQTGNEPLSAGLVFNQNAFSLQIATSFHQYLGFSPSFSLNWHVK